MNLEDDPFYSVASVAKMFDVSDYTVRQWIRDGRIDAIKVFNNWKIRKSECTRLANEEYGS